ncbi:KamA family radical SAM protein [Desulfovibrio ferrophilus]|uniref:Lysine 2,3-aminomutase YodO family protein n=1 Tax=Desulfovibrio ferrophilus TaxID=241368 RepID=A0A2Z6AY32_9BACT|nr:KamA family radical SAM protein [Desulfovibrio ferrophilus]BBD08090.1 lysine 2,3-aminomutase YodO family protein [Desulfovibrio ferrophilus]
MFEQTQTVDVVENPDQPPSSSMKRVTELIGRRLQLSVESDAIREYRALFHADVSDRDWNDWRWQIRHRLTSEQDFERMVELTGDERQALRMQQCKFPAAVTPYYAALIRHESSLGGSALRYSMIPRLAEGFVTMSELNDPLGEEHDSPVPGIVQRYPDRVLFLTTDYCSAYCRYCTRSRRVGRPETKSRRIGVWDRAIEYIREHPEVRDVLLSGGDPLTLSDAALEYLLSRLRAIPHVEMIRLGTKTPMVLPQRITPALTRMLKRYHPLFVSIHCTHPAELTPEAAQACNRLADAGIPLGSQTVLLAGVNDDELILTSLFQGLLRMRVRPYYLYHCDQVAGTSHFRTTLVRGLEIIRSIRGFTSGYAVPHFVVDLPGGGGKTPVCPEYLVRRDGDKLVFRNYEGREYSIADPVGTFQSRPCDSGHQGPLQ